MLMTLKPEFMIHQTPGVEVHEGNQEGFWHLEVPPGPQGSYRLAQLDDYTNLSRQAFPHKPTLIFRLRARVSNPDIPGTWGFGLWNDPFSLSLGLGGGTRRFPALPNAAWFFYASSQNYLSFRDDLPAKGFIAQTFQSPNLPAPLMGLAAPAFPLFLWPWMARNLRPIFRRWITEGSFVLDVDATQSHSYALEWQKDLVIFTVDDQTFETRISPKGALGLVIWIDNQYAAFPPDGKLAYGTLENPQSAWLEIEAFSLKKDIS
jgi:hypothetical protein